MSTFHIHLFSHVFGRLENMTLMSKPLTGIYFNRFNYQLAGPSCRDDTRPYTPLGMGEGRGCQGWIWKQTKTILSSSAKINPIKICTLPTIWENFISYSPCYPCPLGNVCTRMIG